MGEAVQGPIAMLVTTAVSAFVYAAFGGLLTQTACDWADGRAIAPSPATRWSFGWKRFLLYAVASICAGAVAAGAQAAYGGCLAPVCCGVVCAVLLSCDVERRLLPFEPVAALAAVGILLNLGNLASLLEGLLVGSALALATALVRWTGQRRGKASVGGGDGRALFATCLVCGSGALAGGTAACAAAIVWKAVAAWTRRSRWDEPFPFAPFLTIWLLAGMIAC